MATILFNMRVSSEWEHVGRTEFTLISKDAEGRYCLVVTTGVASMHVRPTVAELRNLAAELMKVAECDDGCGECKTACVPAGEAVDSHFGEFDAAVALTT